MNSANAFSYAISGSLNENQANSYRDYVNQGAAMFAGAGGWLAEQANKTLVRIDEFVNSRAWEMGKRLLGNTDGDYVGCYEIGYLGSIGGIQNAQGFMRDVIMSHPALQQLYIDGKIDGYGGEFSPYAHGIGRDNLMYRRLTNGLLQFGEDNGAVTLRHTHYHDSVGGKLSFRERVDGEKTFRAIDHHRLTTMFDLTSKNGDLLKEHRKAEPEE